VKTLLWLDVVSWPLVQSMSPGYVMAVVCGTLRGRGSLGCQGGRRLAIFALVGLFLAPSFPTAAGQADRDGNCRRPPLTALRGGNHHKPLRTLIFQQGSAR
jgi:hypothetical protein